MPPTPPFIYRWEQVDSTTLILGRARLGSPESDPVWQIRKIDDTGVYYANDSSAWNIAWSDRASITWGMPA